MAMTVGAPTVAALAGAAAVSEGVNLKERERDQPFVVWGNFKLKLS